MTGHGTLLAVPAFISSATRTASWSCWSSRRRRTRDEGVQVGALTAAVINLVLVPPVHVRTAEQALTDLRSALGRVVDGMSRDVGAPDWPPSSPEQTRALQDPLSRAREAVDRGSESVLLNPSARRIRSVPRRQREALTSLEYIVVDVRQMARTLSDAADEGPSLFVLGDRSVRSSPTERS